MCKLCWALVVLLTVGIVATASQLAIAGKAGAGTTGASSSGASSSGASSSGRTAISVNAAERDFVLAEMRAFLESVQEITEGLAENNMKQVAAGATKSGRAATHGMPRALPGKLPAGFKKLGFDTHRKFDELASEASEIGDKEIVLKKLGRLLQNCTACHASYEFKLE